MLRIPCTATACCFSLLILVPGADAKKPRAAGKTPAAASSGPAHPAAPAASAAVSTSGDAAPGGTASSPPVAAPAATAEVAAATVPAAAPAAADPAPAAPSGPTPPSVGAAARPAADAPATPPVLTPADQAVAIKHFKAGGKAFAEQRYELALEEFTSSYEISKEPDLLYNLHKVALKLGSADMAITYLQQYARSRPTEAAKIQIEIDQIKAAHPAAPLPAALVSAPPERSTPKSAGYVLIGIGGVSLITGGTLLGVMTTVADATQQRAMLASGAVLLATGVVELIGGVTIVARKRPQSMVALGLTGSGFLLAGHY